MKRFGLRAVGFSMVMLSTFLWILGIGRPLASQEPIPSTTVVNLQANGTKNDDTAKKAAPRAFEQRNGRERLRKALDEPVTVEFSATPLVDVIEYLEGHTEVDFQIDRHAMTAHNIDPELAVTGSLADISLRSALNILLSPHDLGFLLRDGAIWVTTVEAAESAVFMRAYPVSDLTGVGWQADYDRLIELILSTIEPASWMEGTGPGPIDAMFGSLLIPQSEDVHHEISLLINQLRSLKRVQRDLPTGKQQVLFVENPRIGHIREALEQKVDFDFSTVPLSDVAEHFGDLLDIPVILDKQALDFLNLSPDVRVSFRADSICFKDGLTRMLEPHNLAWSVENEVLTITCQEKVEMSIRVYPVFDLIEQPIPGWEDWDHLEDLDPLVEVVRSMTSVTNQAWWDWGGGPGTIATWLYPEALVISQTEVGHEAVVEVLDELRWAKQRESRKSAQIKNDAEKSIRLRRVYHLPALPKEDVRKLSQLIRSEIEPESWEHGDTGIVVLSGRWVIKASPAAHVEIQRLLMELNFHNTFGTFGSMSPNSGGIF